VSDDRLRQEFDLELTGRLLAAGGTPDDSDWNDVVKRAYEHDPATRLAASRDGVDDSDWEAVRARAKQLSRQTRTLGELRRLPGRRPLRLAALTATAAVAALALLFTPKTSTTLIDRAAAAVPGNGQVVHVVWEEAAPRALVDIRSGERLGGLPLRVEAWYDRQRDIYHEVATNADELVWERWHTPQETLDSTEGNVPAWQFAVPAAIRFFSHYKEALAQGRAMLAGSGQVAGTPVYWLVVDTTVETAGPGSSLAFGRVNERDRIALDRKTLVPIQVETADTGILGDQPVKRRIISVDNEPADRASLSRPLVRPWPQPVRDLDGYPMARATQAIQRMEDAARVLNTTPPGLRSSLGGLPVTSVVTDELNPEGTPARTGLRILYGDARNAVRDLRGNYVQLDEALQPELAYAFRPYDTGHPEGLMATSREVPEDVSQAQRGVGAQALEREYVGRLQTRGVFVTIHASSFRLLLLAARTVLGAPPRG
jgi:hypothetical protein